MRNRDGDFYLHFSEEGLKVEDKSSIDELLLEKLRSKEQVEVVEDDEGFFSIFFRNFVGFFSVKDRNYLIIPRKLAKYFNLIDSEGNPKCGFKEEYERKFSSFINSVFKDLGIVAIEGLVFTPSLVFSPVKILDENIVSDNQRFLVLLSLKERLIDAIKLIRSFPHKILTVVEEFKLLSEVSCIDSGAIGSIIANNFFFESDQGIIKFNNKRYLPEKLFQESFEDSLDSLENRFVKHFLENLYRFLLSLPPEKAGLLEDLEVNISMFLASDLMSEVGDLSFFPTNSQVLMKRDGYREIFQIYNLLNSSFIPSLSKDSDLILGLKDMATLWEYYVLSKILKELKDEFGSFKLKLIQKDNYEYMKFEFQRENVVLYYQKSEKSYSNLELRPDFLIIHKGKRFIFDAKFRQIESEKSKVNRNKTKREILLNMHYYKDALKADLAVAVTFPLYKVNYEYGSFYSYEDYSVKSVEKPSFLNFLEMRKEGIGYVILPINVEGLILGEDYGEGY